MKILDKLKRFIKRNKVLRLLAADEGRSFELITIDAIEAIIQDPEVFEKFMDYEANVETFGKNNQLEYITGVKVYFEFMKDKGIKFQLEEMRRIRAIVRLLPKKLRVKMKEEKKQKTKHKQSVKHRANLYNIAQSILNEDDRFDEFMLMREEVTFEGIPVSDLYEFFNGEMYEFYRNFDTSSHKMQDKRLSIIKERIRMRQEGYQINPKLQINQDFENAIMRNIEQGLTPTQFAFSLYNELNKRVRYDSKFFALNQDLTDKFARSVHDKPIEKITEQDNTVICKNWAELYAYFLTKNGYPAYVLGKRHRWVEACIESAIIKADATNVIYSSDDYSSMTDLTRAKLGIRPAGFKVSFSDTEIRDTDLWQNLSEALDYSDTDFSSFEEESELSELMDLIGDERDLSSSVLGVDKNNQLRAVMTKINFINSILKDSKLDNVGNASYLSHLFKTILQGKEQKCVTLRSSVLYRNLYENCELLPIVSIYRGNIQTPIGARMLEDYAFLMFEPNNNQLMPISKQNILEAIARGDITQVKGVKKVEGLPEIEMSQQELQEYLKDNTEQMTDINNEEEKGSIEYEI